MGMVRMVWLFLRWLLVDRTALMAENLALWQQINVLQRSVKRPKFRKRDRIFWVWLSRPWPIGGRAVRPGGLRTPRGKLRHTCSRPSTFPDLVFPDPEAEPRQPGLRFR